MKDIKCRKYYELVEKAKEHFIEVLVKQITHAENQRVDELAQLAISLCDWTTREVISQVELLPQTEVLVETTMEDWRIEFILFFQEGKLPED